MTTDTKSGRAITELKEPAPLDVEHVNRVLSDPWSYGGDKKTEYTASARQHGIEQFDADAAGRAFIAMAMRLLAHAAVPTESPAFARFLTTTGYRVGETRPADAIDKLVIPTLRETAAKLFGETSELSFSTENGCKTVTLHYSPADVLGADDASAATALRAEYVRLTTPDQREGMRLRMRAR